MDPLLKKALRGATPPVSSACVDAERLAAWSDGSLSAHEAEDVELHLSTCARCQAVLATFARTEPAPMPAAVPFWKRPIGWLVPIAAAAAAVLIWIAVPRREAAQVASPASQIAEVAPSPPPVAVAQEAQRPELRKESAPNAAALAEKAEKKDESAAKSLQKTLARPVATTPPPAAAPVAAPVPPPTRAAAAPPPPAPVSVPAPRPSPPPPAGQPVQARPPVTGALSTATDALRADMANRAASRQLAESLGGTIEIVAPGPPNTQPIPVAGGAAGAARGGGGRGAGSGAGRGGAGAPVMAPPPAPLAAMPVRWRILPTSKVERSTDGGGTWDAIALESPSPLTGGVATSSTICWLIGRAGIVFRAVDGVHFARLTFPEAVDLASIRATGAAQASITTADGRVFTTSDGGLTWLQGFPTSTF